MEVAVQHLALTFFPRAPLAGGEHFEGWRRRSKTQPPQVPPLAFWRAAQRRVSAGRSGSGARSGRGGRAARDVGALFDGEGCASAPDEVEGAFNLSGSR